MSLGMWVPKIPKGNPSRDGKCIMRMNTTPTGNLLCWAFLHARFLILATPPGSAVSDKGLRLTAQTMPEDRVRTRPIHLQNSHSSQSKCSGTDKRINMWYAPMAIYYSAMKKEGNLVTHYNLDRS